MRTLILAAALFALGGNAWAAGNADNGKAIAEKVCAACHGADGAKPAAPENPVLAGQYKDYLVKALLDYKSGKRANPIMKAFADQLKRNEVEDVAAWFSSQKQKPAAAKDGTKIALGQQIWRQGDFKKGIPACAGCHGPAGAGLPAQYPRLAGQYPEYTEAQLKTFRSEERNNDPEKMMRMIAAKLSDPEMKAVAEYAAGLR